jgi:Ser/Thr protein kinase RdoA (MazF antagonist)
VDGEGEYWRVYDYIEDSLCLQTPETAEDFYQSAVAFGSFQRMLQDFPAQTLCETIPNFHNTPDRYRIFHETLAADRLKRAASVRREIDFVLAHEAEGGCLLEMLARGELPLRVTHNDTKLNNVMLDRETRRALCVIDLDTVMPGLVAYDFGDSIRFGAATAAEDERDLDRVGLNLALYRRFAEGFIPACGGLTAREIETLPLGAKLMTLECGLRFLTDYLDGDRYFSVARPDHNLDRARTQFKLVEETERRWDEIQAILWAFLP